MKSEQIIFLLLLLMTACGHDDLTQTQFIIQRKVDGNVTSEYVERPGDLEYPRRNPKILAKLKDLWANYYKCLEASIETKPEIRRLQQGLYTELQCQICEKPFENYEELEWKYKQLYPHEEATDSLQNLILTPEMVLTYNKTLKIYNAIESLEGLYVCYRKDSVISIYILEVSTNDTLEKKETENRASETVMANENFFWIYYVWSEWTECNACGRVGEMFKYGTCYVTIKQESDISHTNKRQRSTKNFQQRLITTRYQALKRKMVKKLRPKDLSSTEISAGNWGVQTLEKFSTGIPCASEYLPISISEIIQNFTAVKILVKHCWEPCEKSEIFMVLDSKGKVVETANNSAGIYSMFQEFPQLPPEVERRTITAYFGQDVLIHCPGSSLTNVPPVWKIQNKILFPEVIANDSKGRITIDLLSRIQLKRVRLGDSRTYSCWHKKQLVGTVRLIVQKKFSVRLNHHVILILLLALVITLLLVGRKVLLRELDRPNK